ncbi:hypothetical protein PTSG_02554 [Salpingoeca rosetta]|uniref:Uncharacterized protein n=1 Tax=Salpingoeca rosetta (strain ATCC 50818 / BSB-021) TaxID=946362 RepID=F2U2I7_SALR5|nr:uncharacterized protein PTSG_02554 [Salpingoeca rosetta]EGD81839.1 hypothetical protein PTSG_02554 [Salpingoeca rosetta]|eukprot:XP_004997043.1 hypothetical protein PTSG_02554 [Salpingoeca rosetta]
MDVFHHQQEQQQQQQQQVLADAALEPAAVTPSPSTNQLRSGGMNRRRCHAMTIQPRLCDCGSSHTNSHHNTNKQAMSNSLFVFPSFSPSLTAITTTTTAAAANTPSTADAAAAENAPPPPLAAEHIPPTNQPGNQPTHRPLLLAEAGCLLLGEQVATAQVAFSAGSGSSSRALAAVAAAV